MNEEQLANLLAQHLDAVLAGELLPEMAPAEVVELLAVAQTLSEIAPALRPEFGDALEGSLRSVSDSREFAGEIIPDASVSLGPMNGTGATSGAGSTFRGSTFFTLIMGLLLTVAGLALVAGLVTFVTNLSNSLESPAPAALPNLTQPLMAPTLTGPAGSLSPTTPPTQRSAGDDTPKAGVRTQTPPAQSPSPPTTLAITSTLSAKPAPSPTLIVTPIVDVLPAVIITPEIKFAPPALVPGSHSGDSSGGSGGNGGDSGGNGSGSSSGDRSSNNSDGGNSSSGGGGDSSSNSGSSGGSSSNSGGGGSGDGNDDDDGDSDD